MGVWLEKEVPLERSLLWSLQRRAYGELGSSAWGKGPVPLYITSNPFLARQYGAVLAGHLRDRYHRGELDLKEPVYIVDSGAGAGRFGYLCQKELQRQLATHPQLASLDWVYVLVENVEETVEYWNQHPFLQEAFRKGKMDCAWMDVLESSQLSLRHRGETLTKEKVRNPLVLVANYLFDTLPQGLFKVKNGEILEGRVSLFVEREEVEDFTDPTLIDALQCTFSYHPLSLPFEELDRSVQRVLCHYKEEFEEAVACLPVAGFHFLDNLKGLSPKGGLLLCGDQGIGRKDQVASWGDPVISLHGTFSLPVDYYALGRYFEQEGGAAWRTEDHDTDFVLLAGVTDGGEWVETATAFDLVVNSFEPQNYWNLLNCLEEECPEPSLKQILHLVKLGNWDPPILFAFFDRVRLLAKEASLPEQVKLASCVEKVADHFFPLRPEESAFYTSLGILCFEMRQFSCALPLFEKSCALLPNYGASWLYAGLCYQMLGEREKGAAAIAKGKELDPSL